MAEETIDFGKIWRMCMVYGFYIKTLKLLHCYVTKKRQSKFRFWYIIRAVTRHSSGFCSLNYSFQYFLNKDQLYLTEMTLVCNFAELFFFLKWPLFMDGVWLSQGYIDTTRRQLIYVLTTKFTVVPSAHFINLRRMKD